MIDHVSPAPDEPVFEVELEDPIGRSTLHRMASVDRYNGWIFQEIAPYAGQRLLEVGCGIGNMTVYFRHLSLVVGLDLLQSSVVYVTQHLADYPNIRIHRGDITSANTVAQLMPYAFDTVMCLNVLEHIRDDTLALHNMADLLQPGGHLLLFVPAGMYMFGSLDVALGHHRRYEKQELHQLVEAADLEIIRFGHLNISGIPGWWLNSRLLKRHILPHGQLKLFNRLAPILITCERQLRRFWDAPLGQSLLCIARKRSVV